MSIQDDHAFDLAITIRQSRSTRKRLNKRRFVPGSDKPDRLTKTSSPAVRSPTQMLGDVYEARAEQRLLESGCVILGRQLHCRFGEIDLAVREGPTLVFVEVRSSQTMRYGGAAASVGHWKQKRLILAARWWMPGLTRAHFEGITPACRFDLIAFESGTPVWIRDAFGVT